MRLPWSFPPKSQCKAIRHSLLKGPLCLLGLAGTLWLAPGCRRSPDRNDPDPSATINLTPPGEAVSLHLTYRPAPIRLDRDIIAELVLESPASVTVHLPELDDRFSGLELLGRFEEPQPDDPAQTHQRRIIRLRLQAMPEARLYRLAAMPLRIDDADDADAADRWIASRPHRFDVAPLPPPAEDLDPNAELLDLPLGWRQRMRRMLPGLAALVLLSLAGWWVSRRASHAAPPPSPAERALRELNELLMRNDLAQQRFKDFYVELTLIIRRYIERAHGVRAPEQTTPEFLQAAASHPAFPGPVLKRLRQFLEAADAIKFASKAGNRLAADSAVATARAYIETDAANSGEAGN